MFMRIDCLAAKYTHSVAARLVYGVICSKEANYENMSLPTNGNAYWIAESEKVKQFEDIYIRGRLLGE